MNAKRSTVRVKDMSTQPIIEEQCFLWVPYPQEGEAELYTEDISKDKILCVGGLQYLHHIPASCKKRLKGKLVQRGTTWPWGI
jgi:hypothetical protein